MSHKGHYGSDTPPYGHAPTYQISLTYLERQKKLWSGQASLRRSRRSGSGRKNQTKTKSLPSFGGETKILIRGSIILYFFIQLI